MGRRQYTREFKLLEAPRQRLWAILLAPAVALCAPAIAETPQAAFGVTVIGNGVNCASPVGLRCTNLTGHPYILVGGFSSQGDNGGGYFALGPSGCTDNGGTILKDFVGNCFYRTDSRAAAPVQWFGAKCDALTTVAGGATSEARSACRRFT